MRFFKNKNWPRFKTLTKESTKAPVRVLQTNSTERGYICKTEPGQKLMQIREEAIAEGMQIKGVKILDREFKS